MECPNLVHKEKPLDKRSLARPIKEKGPTLHGKKMILQYALHQKKMRKSSCV